MRVRLLAFLLAGVLLAQPARAGGCSAHDFGSPEYRQCLEDLAMQYEALKARSTSLLEKAAINAELLWISSKLSVAQMQPSGSPREIPACLEGQARVYASEKWRTAYEFAQSSDPVDFRKALDGAQDKMTAARGNGAGMDAALAEHFFYAARMTYYAGADAAMLACEVYEPVQFGVKRLTNDWAGVKPHWSSIPKLVAVDLCAIRWAMQLPGVNAAKRGEGASWNPGTGFGTFSSDDPVAEKNRSDYTEWLSERCVCQGKGDAAACRTALAMTSGLDYCAGSKAY